MTERDVVVMFTKGVLDRLRDEIDLYKIPEVGTWKHDGVRLILDCGFVSATVTPIKAPFHSNEKIWYRVDIYGTKKSDCGEVGRFPTLEIATDTAESYVYGMMRGVFPLSNDSSRSQQP